VIDGVRLALIAAVGRNGVVGHEGALPWHLPADLRHFRRCTTGHTVVLGRRTWAELGRPLPKRRMVVVSATLAAPAHAEVQVASDLAAALALAVAWERAAVRSPAERVVWLLGGPRLWREAWPHTDEAWLTEVDLAPEGDTLFPTLDLDAFTAEVLSEDPGPPALRFTRHVRRLRR
jgi:dihydrofolate reductase